MQAPQPLTVPFPPQLPLELTRSFTQSRDGTYEPWGSPGAEEESAAPLPPEKQPPLRPQELQTFLKVGEWGDQGSLSPSSAWQPQPRSPRSSRGDRAACPQHWQPGARQQPEQSGGVQAPPHLPAALCSAALLLPQCEWGFLQPNKLPRALMGPMEEHPLLGSGGGLIQKRLPSQQVLGGSLSN